MRLDALGWIATAIFSSSYFFRSPRMLRSIQALAALLWVAYGLAIGALPVVVANVIVAAAALYSSLITSRKAAAREAPTAKATLAAAQRRSPSERY
ncbi:MAG TPA: hypothetical protein VFA28_19000 [Bryobacteraceae bacterium]|jgi:hypothetical protein|nr:hypothetical protein [Bryobacteraceae bacterium]